MFVDLDRFKSVNDTYGHHIGDELLIGVAERLTSLLRPGDTLARLAGDEFVVLCEDLEDAADVEPIAARIAVAFGGAFVLSTADVYVSASVGIAFAGPGEDVPEDILRDADTAMYQAKRRGGANHGIVDLREQNLARHRASLNRDLPGALARGELRTEYQPIVATEDRRIVAVEALLRWSPPDPRGHSPDDRGPAGRALRPHHRDRALGAGPRVPRPAAVGPRQPSLEVSVNVSVRQLMAPDFAATVAAVLNETGTDPRRVTLELTESVFIHDSARALRVLTDLKHLGVMLALDDFGTGYSSLSYLKEFPVDIVKMDRTFIADLGREPASASSSARSPGSRTACRCRSSPRAWSRPTSTRRWRHWTATPARASTSPAPRRPTRSTWRCPPEPRRVPLVGSRASSPQHRHRTGAGEVP